ncbi:rhamnogalacturonan lyase [Microbacterium sp. ProA8]|uniref:rhamnogalacturonan lyase n=1 Tax=Microbacterium chionoecetis TaxID=3153754 RepID=UPI003267DF2F
MNLRNTCIRAVTAGAAACALSLGLAQPALAEEVPPAGAQLEALDRGLVAVSTGEGVFLSWRLLATEAGPSTESGVSGPSFAVFRDGERIATVDDSTNYADPAGSAASVYTVAPAWHDVTGEQSAPVSVWGDGFYDLPLQKPADGVAPKSVAFPAGEPYTYSANDAAVADVDGDGAYEFVVKWDPSNSKDVSQKGYTGPVYVDTYELDGTLLNRIDLGVNIRAGAHYTQFMVYDFDGDGRSETMLKTAPGTTSTRYNADGTAQAPVNITMLAEDLAAGYKHTDDYRMSAADYRAHLIEVFEGWSEHPEVVAGNWPATLEEAFGIPIAHEYPLSEASATELVDYFITTYAPSRSARNDLTNFEGFIVDGPEYLTVFDSATGEELETVRYEPGRDDDGLLWGDYAMARIEPGNRVDRFLAGVAYLDGTHPSAVFARGYYTRSTIAAYDWDGEHLSTRWFVDSGHVPMTNPFNDGPHGRDGTDPEFGTITTQGFHSLSAADVDGDGKHEIVYGAATIDDDGGLLYSSFDELPAGSAAPGETVRLGHGDAMHVTDIDPNRPGLEIWTAHEGGTFAPYGSAMRDAATGEVLFGAYSGRDTGRSMIGDVRADVPGIEVWASMPGGTEASGLLSASGGILGSAIPGTNQSIRWAADLTTQIVNGSGDQNVMIDDWTRGRLLTADGTRTNNGTKGNPSLVADVLGDWREELLVRTADSSALRIFTSSEVTAHKLPTLMHDVQYRAEVARQNTTYNQPSYTSYYLASDMDFANVPVRTTAATPHEPKFVNPSGSASDHVVVAPDPSFDYYVNGVKAEKPLVKVPAGSDVRVTAVPKAGFAVAAGAVSTWTHAFSADD